MKKTVFSKGMTAMRMRKKKHGAERIAACAEILIDQPTQTVDPEIYFSVNQPIHLEIGCGKGDFAVGMSAANPDQNWIAMERVADVACLALEKAMRAKDSRPDNLRFLIGDARNASDWFLPHSVDCIYLNFSDPWPKKGYAKRRLTYQSFLEQYRNLLKPGGLLRLKTDNEGLFLFSLEQFELCGLTVEWKTNDLHASEKAEGNIMTEYERNFSEKGQPIYSAWVRF